MKNKFSRIFIFLSLVFALLAITFLEPKTNLGFDSNISASRLEASSQSGPFGACQDLQESHSCHFGHCSYFSEEQIESNAPETILTLLTYNFFVPVRFPEPLGQPPDLV